MGELRAGTSWAAVLASGLFLGVCAMFYTLYAGLFAFVACLMALYLAVSAWFAASNSSRPDAEVLRPWIERWSRVVLGLPPPAAARAPDEPLAQ